MAAVATFQIDSNRKSLVEPHPVQSFFNIWQAADACVVLLKESPSDAFDLTLKACPWIAEKRDVCPHSGADSVKLIFPEIREYVPVTLVHQRENRHAGICELSLRNIEIGDVAVERSADKAIIEVQLRILDGFLRRSQPLVYVANHSQRILSFLELRRRAYYAGVGCLELVARFDHVVVRDEVVR